MILFLVLTFAATWTLWLLPDLLGTPREGPLALGGPVFLLGVFAPGLVAIALTVGASGRSGVARLLAGITRWRVAGRYYAFAALLAAASRLAAAALLGLATGEWSPLGPTPLPLLIAAAVLSAPVQAGEEVGWRGYLLPRLASAVGLGPASVVVGLIWAAWHLPLFFIAGSGSDGQSFPVYALWVVPWAVALAWLYWRTGGSLLLAMLLHAAINNTSGVVPAAPTIPGPVLGWHATPVAWTSIAITWLVTAVLLVDMRKAEHGARRSSAVPWP